MELNGIKYIFQKHTGIVILTISLILTFVMLYLLRNIILPFLIGLVLAYILIPVVSWIERRFPRTLKRQTVKRVSAIFLVYTSILLVVGTASYYVVTTTIDSFTRIVDDTPDFVLKAFETIQDWLSTFRNLLPAGADQPLVDMLNNLGVNLGEAFRNLFSSIGKLIPATVTYAMGFAALPLFLFYILKDHQYLSNSFYSWLPENAARHVKNVIAIIIEVLGGYIRAQLILGLFVFVLALIGLLIIDAPLVIGLAAVAGVTELVPILGPWIGGGIAVLVVLATEPAKVIWVIVIFFAIQLIENSLLVPRIQGHYLNVHPAIAIVLLIVGASVAGFWGLILAVPLASTLMRLYEYVIRTAKEEGVD